MAGNITEEQFRKFCKDFVEKYEGRYFQEIIKSLGEDLKVSHQDIISKNSEIIHVSHGLAFWVDEQRTPMFCYMESNNSVFINTCGSSDNFYTIKDLYKFFKMYENRNYKFTLDNNMCHNWEFESVDEMNLAESMSIVAKNNGLSSNDMIHIFPLVLRMLKSKSKWSE